MIDTSKVIPFISRQELTASSNVENFIAHMKRCFVGTDSDWRAVRWPGIGFSKLGCKTVRIPDDMMLDAEFMEFAKAYILHRRVTDAGANIAQLGIMLRCLEAALVSAHGSGRIHLCTTADLDEAAQIAQAHYARDTAYGTGIYLKQFAVFVSYNFMSGQNLKGWLNPQPRPADRMRRTGKTGEEIRAKKLPSDAAMNAMAEIFAGDPSEPRDIAASSVFALLMCAPSRVNEILALRADAQVEEMDRDGILRYGWRFYSSKNFAGDIKWIPSSMVDTAKTAFRRMTEFSAPARALAAWLEQHPDRFYRHEMCPNVDEDQPLSLFQATEALGHHFPDRASATDFMSVRKLSCKDGAYTLKDLWLKLGTPKIPRGFPWVDEKKGVRYSNCIFSALEFQLGVKKWTNTLALQKVSRNFLSKEFAPEVGRRGLLERHGYLDPSGKPFKLTTHQPRHFLNTIAQRGGLSNLSLAKWSGRANVKSNQVYNHVDDAEVFDKLRSLRAVEQHQISVEVHHDVHDPIRSDDALIYRDGAAHVTEFGYCVHNFVISPCTKFRDCVNCTEQVCVKGHAQSRERLMKRLEQLEQILATARQGEILGNYGADKWVAHHVTTIARINSMLVILNDPEIADGALVKLRGKDFSQLSRVFSRIESDSSSKGAI